LGRVTSETHIRRVKRFLAITVVTGCPELF
jgi:hypothetical protein